MGRRVGHFSAVVVIAVVAARLVGATSAQAVKVDMGGDAYGTTILEICCGEPGERNDITVQPFGSVPADNASDPAFPNEPLGVVVTDTRTPFAEVTGRCVQLSPNSVRCIELNGIDTVEATFNPNDGHGPGDSFTVDP